MAPGDVIELLVASIATDVGDITFSPVAVVTI
jgi:hypothetical protein